MVFVNKGNNECSAMNVMLNSSENFLFIVVFTFFIGILRFCAVEKQGYEFFGFFAAGISEENLMKLIQHAQIPLQEKFMLENMKYLGVPVFADVTSWF